MSPNTVVGLNRRARLPGEGASPLTTDTATRDTGSAPSISQLPLVDPHGVARILPRTRQPNRVLVGGATVTPAVQIAPAPPAFSRAGTAASAPAAPSQPEAAAYMPPPVMVLDNPEVEGKGVASDFMEQANHDAELFAASTLADVVSRPTVTRAAPRPQPMSRSQTSPKRATQPTRTVRPAGPAINARNTMVGLLLSYMEHASTQIGRPLSLIMDHFGVLIIGLMHVLAPIGLCSAIAHFYPETFMQGGYIANIGKLFSLFFASAFAWSLIYISAAWVVTNVKSGATRFERIGRGIFSPNSKD